MPASLEKTIKARWISTSEKSPFIVFSDVSYVSCINTILPFVYTFLSVYIVNVYISEINV